MRLTLLLWTVCCAGVQFPTRQRANIWSARFRPSQLIRRPESVGRPSSGYNSDSPEDIAAHGDSGHVFTRRDTDSHTTRARSVVFPGPWEVSKSTESPQPLTEPTARSASLQINSTTHNCSIKDFTAFYPPTGQCEKLLERGPCGKDQWLILRPPTNTPVCSLKPCVRGFVNTRRNCTTEVRCHFDRSPFATPQGDVLCLCNAGTVLWREDGQCYRLFSKGPCPAGAHLVLDAFDEPVCMVNPCGEESMVVYKDPDAGSAGGNGCMGCHRLQTRGPCSEDYIYEVDVRTMQPGCISAEIALDIRQLLRTAAFRCPSGTFRSFSGACKKGIAVKDYRTAFFG